MDELKQKVLQQLIDEMDSRSVDDIKSKMMPAKVEVAAESPEDLKEGLDLAKEVIPEKSLMDKMKSHDMSDMPSEDSEPKEDDDKLMELMEMYKKLC